MSRLDEGFTPPSACVQWCQLRTYDLNVLDSCIRNKVVPDFPDGSWSGWPDAPGAGVALMSTFLWTVKATVEGGDAPAVAAHIVGSAACQACPRKFVQQVRTGKPLVAKIPLLNLPAPVGCQPIAYLFDVGFTRDVTGIVIAES